METTFGDQIKINGEEVPEYLLKALYEWYQRHRVIVATSIHCSGLAASKISGGRIETQSNRG